MARKRSRLWVIWRGIKLRCYCLSHKSYNLYGGRGIDVCPEWKNSFKTFQEWALVNGYEEHLTIERNNNDLGYEPSNCKWATWLEQERHRRNNLPPITAFGETKPIWDWLVDARCIVSRNVLLGRIRTGRDPEWALTAKQHYSPRRNPHTQEARLKMSETRRRMANAKWFKILSNEFDPSPCALG